MNSAVPSRYSTHANQVTQQLLMLACLLAEPGTIQVWSKHLQHSLLGCHNVVNVTAGCVQGVKCNFMKQSQVYLLTLAVYMRQLPNGMASSSSGRLASNCHTSRSAPNQQDLS